MNIKVCGITQLKQLQQLDALNIDFAGLVFDDKSPRCVKNKLKPSDLRDADFDIRKVGVFVNATVKEVLKAIDEYSLDVVQLHGDESPDFCDKVSGDAEVIKAFHVGDNETNIDALVKNYDAVCDYYLFDTVSAGYDGSGKQSDWSAIANAKIEKPFFLSGGISLEDVSRLNAFKHPDLFAVDINSRFETAPGAKDMRLVLQFQQALKKVSI
jgi:phosphoribosylanthranilate isomerase